MTYISTARMKEICAAHGIDSRDATPLRQHATAVFHLPREHAVARCSPLASASAVTRTVDLVRWLLDQGLPATELVIPQPITTDDTVLTIWRYYPQPCPTPPAQHLGALLRELHQLPPPPMPLPTYTPLASLQAAIDNSRSLTPDTCDWLHQTIKDCLRAYSELHSTLGTGLVHGDAYPGNTLWDSQRRLVRLGDWDEAATGPRELDLANTYQGVRFGRTMAEIDAFTRAYGKDPGPEAISTLAKIRDLHTLAAFIRRTDDAGDVEAKAQLDYRISTLRQGDTTARWDMS